MLNSKLLIVVIIMSSLLLSSCERVSFKKGVENIYRSTIRLPHRAMTPQQRNKIKQNKYNKMHPHKVSISSNDHNANQYPISSSQQQARIVRERTRIANEKRQQEINKHRRIVANQIARKRQDRYKRKHPNNAKVTRNKKYKKEVPIKNNRQRDNRKIKPKKQQQIKNTKKRNITNNIRPQANSRTPQCNLTNYLNTHKPYKIKGTRGMDILDKESYVQKIASLYVRNCSGVREEKAFEDIYKLINRGVKIQTIKGCEPEALELAKIGLKDEIAGRYPMNNVKYRSLYQRYQQCLESS